MTLCSFLLPFFYNACGPDANHPHGPGFGPSPEDSLVREIAIKDSIERSTKATQENSKDTNQQIIISNSINTIDSLKTVSINNDKIRERNESNSAYGSIQDTVLSERLSKKYPFLRPFLIISKKFTITGLGMIIDTMPYLTLFAIFNSFLLLLISLIIKYIDKHARKALILLEFTSFIALIISEPTFYE